MDPRTSAQDKIQCDLCETAVVQMHCDTCLVNLCKACVGEHFSADLSKPHKIVDFKDRKSTLFYPECTSHNKKRCKMYCNQCDIPVCTKCLASDQHLGHRLSEILQVVDERRDKLAKDQIELNETIYPTYQDIASDVQNRMTQLEKEYGELSMAITKHGDDLHIEIDKLVSKLKAEADEIKRTQLQTLQKHLNEMKKTIFEIKEEINLIDVVVDSRDITKLFGVTLNVDKYRQLPHKIVLSLPKLTSGRINVEQLTKLSGASLSKEKNGYGMRTIQKLQEVGSYPPVKQLIDEPETITTIHTGYRYYVQAVACLSEEEIWTVGSANIIKLFSIKQRSHLKSVTTKSGNFPMDIAVTKSGDLVYTDYLDKTVNIVKNEKIEKVIRLGNWTPFGVCSTSSGYLVFMGSDDWKQLRIVRYSGSTQKQTIQFDDRGKPLYSSGGYLIKQIKENRNLDICVADSGARAVVVVSQAGNLRFRYTGHTSAPKSEPFSPLGITTDSQGNILTADFMNHCVHIIDQYGQFLRYIDCGLNLPSGLCIDTSDNLFVSQRGRKEVQKIKYLQ